tara:strand:+ start:132 stop:536 length:405 start_codon:yes stop_codon:yes gene_type:complete
MKVIRPWLSVGKFLEPRDRELMVSRGIGAILALYWPVKHEGIDSLYLPVEDGVPLEAEVLTKGVEFILQHKAQGHGVLVACRFGISRSVTFAVAAIKEAEGLSLDEALSSVIERHQSANPGEVLWSSLRKYYQD